MPSSSFVFGNFYVAFSPLICCRSLPRFRSFVRVSYYRACSVSSPLFEFVVIGIVPVAGIRFRLRLFFVRALSCVFLRFVVLWFAFVLIVRCNRYPCFEGRFSFVRSCYFAFSLGLVPSYRHSFVSLSRLRWRLERSGLVVSFRRVLVSFFRYALFVGYSALVAFVFRFSLSFLVSSSFRYLVVVYRTDGRFVSSLIVSLVPVPRSSSVVRVNVCVIVGIPSSVVVVAASFIVHLAFLEVA